MKESHIEVSKFLSLGLGALSHFLGHGFLAVLSPGYSPHTKTHNQNEKEEMTSKKNEMLLMI